MEGNLLYCFPSLEDDRVLSFFLSPLRLHSCNVQPPWLFSFLLYSEYAIS